MTIELAVSLILVTSGVSFILGAFWGVWARHTDPRATTTPSTPSTPHTVVLVDPYAHHRHNCGCVYHR